MRLQAALAAGVLAAAGGLYALQGEPDAARGDRLALSAELLQAAADGGAVASPEALAGLDAHLRRQPDDARALVLKARLELRAERHQAAAAAFQRAVAASPRVAGDPEVWLDYAEARGLADGGTLRGEAAALVGRALALAPDHARALDLAGSAAWERQDPATAARHWQRLLAQLAPGDVRRAALAAAVERAEQRARFALPERR